MDFFDSSAKKLPTNGAQGDNEDDDDDDDDDEEEEVCFILSRN